jgi:hypothetical protein
MFIVLWYCVVCFSDVNLCKFLSLFLSIFSLEIQLSWGGRDPINRYKPPHVCAYSKQRHGLLIGQWPVRTKLMHPACSCVASRGVFTLLCMLYSNNLKALCIPHGEGRTKFLRKKYGKRPYKYKEKNNAAIILRNLILCIDGYVYHIPGSVTFVDSRYMKRWFWCYFKFVSL